MNRSWRWLAVKTKLVNEFQKTPKSSSLLTDWLHSKTHLHPHQRLTSLPISSLSNIARRVSSEEGQPSISILPVLTTNSYQKCNPLSGVNTRSSSIRHCNQVSDIPSFGKHVTVLRLYVSSTKDLHNPNNNNKYLRSKKKTEKKKTNQPADLTKTSTLNASQFNQTTATGN